MTRYVLGETSKVLAATTVIMIFLMLVVGLGREAWEHSLPVTCVLRLVPYLLPDALRVGLPVAVLLAVVWTFGRLSGFNELLAVKASGVSPVAIVAPVLALAFALSLFTVWMNDLAAAWGRRGVQRVVIEAAEDIVYTVLRLQRRFQHGRVLIEVRNVIDRRLIEPMLVIYGSRPNSMITISAREAELVPNPQLGTLKIRLYSGTVEADGQWRIDFPDVYEREIRLSERTGDDRGLPPSALALREIPNVLNRCREELQDLQERLRQGTSDRNPGRRAVALPENLEAPAERLSALQDYIHRLETEPFRRWAAGFSCLVFAVVGSGMAMRLRQAEWVTAFFLCFVPILVAYYPLLAWTVDAAKSGSIPPWAVWAGNVVLAGWGGTLLWYEFRR